MLRVIAMLSLDRPATRFSGLRKGLVLRASSEKTEHQFVSRFSGLRKGLVLREFAVAFPTVRDTRFIGLRKGLVLRAQRPSKD